MLYRLVDSPIGSLLLAGDDDGLRYLWFANGRRAAHPRPEWEHDRSTLNEAAEQLKAYFSGDLRAFDVPLAPEGTSFQRRVWRALCDIPYGETTSYGELARRIGN